MITVGNLLRHKKNYSTLFVSDESAFCWLVHRVVERSDLAALEFLMSKQPRGNVRVGASHTAGARVSNIFVEVQKFQTRFQEALEKASMKSCKVSLTCNGGYNESIHEWP